jgi:hypothetical protein
MLSHLPMIFQTSGGSMEVLIEEMQETDATGDRITFVGRIVVGAQTGARVAGHYDCQRTTGSMTVTTNGH